MKEKSIIKCIPGFRSGKHKVIGILYYAVSILCIVTSIFEEGYLHVGVTSVFIIYMLIPFFLVGIKKIFKGSIEEKLIYFIYPLIFGILFGFLSHFSAHIHQIAETDAEARFEAENDNIDLGLVDDYEYKLDQYNSLVEEYNNKSNELALLEQAASSQKVESDTTTNNYQASQGNVNNNEVSNSSSSDEKQVYIASNNNYYHYDYDCKFIRNKDRYQVPFSEAQGKYACHCVIY